MQIEGMMKNKIIRILKDIGLFAMFAFLMFAAYCFYLFIGADTI